MSLKTIPAFGKSGTSRTAASKFINRVGNHGATLLFRPQRSTEREGPPYGPQPESYLWGGWDAASCAALDILLRVALFFGARHRIGLEKKGAPAS